MGTDLVRSSALDLTRSPSEQWNDEMVELVTRSVFRGTQITKNQLYYCLAVAEGIGLNPMIGEVYFIPSKSTDGKGPGIVPYVGRNGLVVKASQRGYYYESDTVHEHDRFRVTRKRDGTVELTHSYGFAERGEIVGAYAFLHKTDGSERPAFYLAKLGEYLPEFDADWKMAKSPWGNQRSAMIEKCAMIGAGRKRLDLGNVLADGEIARVEQMQEIGPHAARVTPEGEPDWPAVVAEFTETPAVRDELAAALRNVNAALPLAWTPAKVEMVAAGMGDPELLTLAEQIQAEAERANHAQSQNPPSEPTEPDITDAQVVDEEHVAALRRQKSQLEDRLNEPGIADDESRQLTEELEGVERELHAAGDPTQGKLL